MEDETLIYYYVGSGRKTLTARFMRSETRLCDKSTGRNGTPFNTGTWRWS